MRAACGTLGGCGFEDGGLRHASTSNLKPHTAAGVASQSRGPAWQLASQPISSPGSVSTTLQHPHTVIL